MSRKPTKIGRRYLKSTAPLFSTRRTTTLVHISAYDRAMPDRRFPPPWTAELTPNCFIVRDANGQALAYVYFEDEPERRSEAKLLQDGLGSAHSYPSALFGELHRQSEGASVGPQQSYRRQRNPSPRRIMSTIANAAL